MPDKLCQEQEMGTILVETRPLIDLALILDTRDNAKQTLRNCVSLQGLVYTQNISSILPMCLFTPKGQLDICENEF